MSATIPQCVRGEESVARLEAAGLKLLHQGKVRDIFSFNTEEHRTKLLFVSSNRLSIFDFVLPTLVPSKGMVLTAMTVFWLTEVLNAFSNHLLAYGAGIDDYLPEALRHDLDLQSRAIVVQREHTLPIECIVRGNLTGSGWKSYRESRTVCGHILGAGLRDGDRLPYPLFTPTTKADVGHDEHLDAYEVEKRYGQWPQNVSVGVFLAGARYASERGIIIADTKFELGQNGLLCDEVLTPDSSRFWDAGEWKLSREKGTSPTSHDKEVVRTWGKTVVTTFEDAAGNKIVGIDKLEPTDAAHLEFIETVAVPQQVIDDTARRYLNIFERLVGKSLDDFQNNKMGLRL